MRPCQNRSYTMRRCGKGGAQARRPPRAPPRTPETKDLRRSFPGCSVAKFFRLLPAAGENVRLAPAAVWARACAPEADGFFPADRRAHTSLERGKCRLAIRDRRSELCLR